MPAVERAEKELNAEKLIPDLIVLQRVAASLRLSLIEGRALKTVNSRSSRLFQCSIKKDKRNFLFLPNETSLSKSSVRLASTPDSHASIESVRCNFAQPAETVGHKAAAVHALLLDGHQDPPDMFPAERFAVGAGQIRRCSGQHSSGHTEVSMQCEAHNKNTMRSLEACVKGPVTRKAQLTLNAKP